MSTLAEIEAALARLAPAELDELATLLENLRAAHADESDLAELERHIGFVPFPKRAGEPVTTELVRQLCEEEGV